MKPWRPRGKKEEEETGTDTAEEKEDEITEVGEVTVVGIITEAGTTAGGGTRTEVVEVRMEIGPTTVVEAERTDGEIMETVGEKEEDGPNRMGMAEKVRAGKGKFVSII